MMWLTVSLFWSQANWRQQAPGFFVKTVIS